MTTCECMVWDTTGPVYASACGHLAWLLDAAGTEKRHLIPSVVAEEMSALGVPLPADADGGVEIIDCEAFTELEDFAALAAWMEVLGTDLEAGHNVGEAFTAFIAAREEHSVAIVDDRDATSAIRSRRDSAVEVRGVLWAISRGVFEDRAAGPNAYSGLCDAMLNAQKGTLRPLRWPCERGGYPTWFEKNRAALAR